MERNHANPSDARPALTLRLTGENAALETTSITVMTRLSRALERLVSDIGGGVEHMSLVSVQNESAGYTFATDDFTADLMSGVLNVASLRSFDELPEQARPGWREMARAVPEGKSLQLRQTQRDGNSAEATVEPLGIELKGPSVIRGETTVYGRVRSAILKKDAGASVWLDAVGHSKRVVCDVATDLAKELGRRLDEEVALRGIGTWAADDLELKAFRATKILAYGGGSLTSALAALAKAAEGRWQDVDVDQFTRESRGR